jgi:hypothetical protein
MGLMALLLLQTPVMLAASLRQEPKQKLNETRAVSEPNQGGENRDNVQVSIPELSLAKRQEIETFAQMVADNVVLKDDGTVGINSAKAKNLSRVEQRQLSSAVGDVNSGHIGILATNEDGSTRLYGNQAVLDASTPSSGSSVTQNNLSLSTAKNQSLQALVSTWWDGYGYAIYLDPTFTKRLESFDNAAIGTLIGLMVVMVCGTGIGCVASTVVVAFFWDQVWQWLSSRYFVTSLIIHIPRWNWVYLQPFKAGAWYNGGWFRTWLWT